MLSIFSCARGPSVCLLWRNDCLGLPLIFQLGCLFFWYWAEWAVCIFWRLIPCQFTSSANRWQFFWNSHGDTAGHIGDQEVFKQCNWGKCDLFLFKQKARCKLQEHLVFPTKLKPLILVLFPRKSDSLKLASSLSLALRTPSLLLQSCSSNPRSCANTPTPALSEWRDSLGMGLGEHTAFLFLSKQLLTSTGSTCVAAGPGPRVRVLEAGFGQEVAGYREGGAVLSAARTARTQLKLVRVNDGHFKGEERQEREAAEGPPYRRRLGRHWTSWMPVRPFWTRQPCGACRRPRGRAHICDVHPQPPSGPFWQLCSSKTAWALSQNGNLFWTNYLWRSLGLVGFCG